jgi:hypothetical protein
VVQIEHKTNTFFIKLSAKDVCKQKVSAIYWVRTWEIGGAGLKNLLNKRNLSWTEINDTFRTDEVVNRQQVSFIFLICFSDVRKHFFPSGTR